MIVVQVDLPILLYIHSSHSIIKEHNHCVTMFLQTMGVMHSLHLQSCVEPALSPWPN